jgi:hypothetical protein
VTARARRAASLSITIALAAAGAALFFVLVRRRLPSRPRGGQDSASRADAALALRLYERLDEAMRARGRARPPGVPPLRHAEALVASGDPLGPVILDLTRAYLSVRFGGVTLADDQRLAFEQRVRTLADASAPGTN